MNKTIKVPSFYKNDLNETYLGIVSEDRMIKICNLTFNGPYRTVQILGSDQKTIDNCMPFVHEISADIFFSAYNKCLQDITKDVARATA